MALGGATRRGALARTLRSQDLRRRGVGRAARRRSLEDRRVRTVEGRRELGASEVAEGPGRRSGGGVGRSASIPRGRARPAANPEIRALQTPGGIRCDRPRPRRSQDLRRRGLGRAARRRSLEDRRVRTVEGRRELGASEVAEGPGRRSGGGVGRSASIPRGRARPAANPEIRALQTPGGIRGDRPRPRRWRGRSLRDRARWGGPWPTARRRAPTGSICTARGCAGRAQRSSRRRPRRGDGSHGSRRRSRSAPPEAPMDRRPLRMSAAARVEVGGSSRGPARRRRARSRREVPVAAGLWASSGERSAGERAQEREARRGAGLRPPARRGEARASPGRALSSTASPRPGGTRGRSSGGREGRGRGRSSSAVRSRG